MGRGPASHGALDAHRGPSFQGAPHGEVDAVLRDAAQHLVQYFPGRDLPPIKVEHGAPRIYWRHGNHQGGPADLITISAQGRVWTQYIYQFSHELCHQLQNADVKGSHEAAWFGETLSELASQFVLRASSRTWKTNPPYGNAQYYADAIGNYARTCTDRYVLPEGMTLAGYYREHEAELRASSYHRKLNGHIATALLPLFEAAPEHWEALSWMCLRREEMPLTQTLSFPEFLAEWKHLVPPRHKPFVQYLGRGFEIDLRNQNHLVSISANAL